MKKLLLTIAAVTVSVATMYGQGRVAFNNITSGNLVTIGPLAAAGQGAVGANIGQTYSAQLLWAAGTFNDINLFLAAGPQSSSPVAFFGATGGGPTSDGAGLFDGGTVAMNGVAGTYTMLVRAWYNGSGTPTTYATYAAALGASANTGQSALFSMNVTAPPAGVNPTLSPAFTVGVVPEPSTFVLAGLGIASLLLFRRRK
jgi:hypothetical protein